MCGAPPPAAPYSAVFESMHMNLREVLKKYGRNVGINIHGTALHYSTFRLSTYTL